MKLNWLVRFKNKTWLLGFFTAIVAFVYQMLGLFDIVPAVTHDQIMQVVLLIVNVLVGLGVLVDPTTSGISDSKLALTYTEPRKKKDQTIFPVSEREHDGKDGGWL